MDYNELEQLGTKFGLNVHACIHAIFVKSPKGNWYFTECADGKFNLYHENAKISLYRGNFETKYHFQKSFENIKDIYIYIKRHDKKRYTKNEPTARKCEKMFKKIESA